MGNHRTDGTGPVAAGVAQPAGRTSRRELLKATGAAAAGLLGAPALGTVSRVLAQAPKYGGMLTFASAALPASIEPHLEGADIWQQRKPLIYENLVVIDDELMPRPQLAERWERVSDVEYVFYLRRGVRFHNGKEMDAEDVKYSYERVMDPKTGSGGRGDLIMIQSIEVIDRYTLRFKLHEPSATFLINLGGKYNGVIPKDYVKTGTELQASAVGTGPFKVERFEPNQRISLRRFEQYWDAGKPYLDGVEYIAVPDESSIVAGLRAGRIHAAVLATPINFQVVSRERDLNSIRAPAIRWVVLDLAGDMEPTSNPDVRRAIALAIDRETVLQIAGAGLGDRLGVLPPAMTYWAVPWQELPNQVRDVSAARALLRKAGYARGLDMRIRNITGFPELADSLQVIVDNLREAGINVTVETVDIGVWIRDWIQRQAPPTMNVWGGFVDPDQTFYRHYHSPPKGMDFRRWNNPEVDRLLDEGRVTLEPEKRRPIYRRVQQLMAEDPISVPLYAPNLLYSLQKSVQGFRPHPTGFHYGLRFAWMA